MAAKPTGTKPTGTDPTSTDPTSTDPTGTDRAGTHRTARERAREEITAELLAEARRQLAQSGPNDLSLRSVARALGMVSSAVYRYFDSRDALLTRLIIDAYEALGDAAEATAEPTAHRSDAERWTATAHAIRQWALDHRHEYALLYGSPVPGYAAPDGTVAPGIRVSLALIAIVADAADAGRLAPPALSGPAGSGAGGSPSVGAELAADLNALVATIGVDLEPATMVAVVAAWTQLFGLVSFELFNQTRDMVSDDASLFDTTVALMAHVIGLR